MRVYQPSIAVRVVQPLLAALEVLGYDPNSILESASIEPEVLQNPDGRLPHEGVIRFWGSAYEISNDDQLGIHLAEAVPIRSFEVHYYAMLSSPTLRDAYHRACRYQRLVHETTNLTLIEGAQEGVIQHALPSGKAVPRHPAEFLATLWVRFGRLITGIEWAPSLVCFAHQEPQDLDEHIRVFQSSLRFASGATAMHVPNDILDTKIPQADDVLLSLIDKYAHGLLMESPGTSSLADRVRTWIGRELVNGTPTASAAAAAGHMSVRTLHRILQEEGTSFREIMDQLRHQQAVALLADKSCTIAEAGYLLGFSELSSFSRAFKRWTGTGPAAYRSALDPTKQ